VTKQQQADLAKYLARKIFECPADVGPHDVARIAFRGDAPHVSQERDFGGLCEEALANVILEALEAR
jgi:hypothetical protein